MHEQPRMLSLEETLRLQTSIAGVEAVASQALQLATRPWQAIAFVSTLHQNLDRVAAVTEPAATAQTTAAVECRSGCSYCCSVRVELTDPEALQIAEHVQQQPDAERAALVLRLQHKASHFGGVEPLHPQRLPCAFLVDHRCSIYALRPSACRKAHSLSAAACAAGAATIPQSVNLLLRSEALIAGTRQAYQNQGLPATGHELSAAVLAALQDPGAAENWYQGRPLLAP